MVGLKPITREQAERVKADFDIDIDGYANSVDCQPCGHAYTTYEFVQQGYEEHGGEAVRTAFSLNQVAILQVNLVQDTICRNCRLHMLSTSGETHTEESAPRSGGNAGSPAWSAESRVLSA
jgi:hypothetical protein